MAGNDETTVEETIVLEKKLREMGFRIAEGVNLHDFLGKKLKIVPVRIGMPGEDPATLGKVFGPPKNDTRYPIDHIRVIKENGSYFVFLFSSKAGNKHITERSIDLEGLADLGRQKAHSHEMKMLPPGKEPKLLTAGSGKYPIKKWEPPYKLPEPEISQETRSREDDDRAFPIPIIPGPPPRRNPRQEESKKSGGGTQLIVQSFPMADMEFNLYKKEKSTELNINAVLARFGPRYGQLIFSIVGEFRIQKHSFSNKESAKKWLEREIKSTELALRFDSEGLAEFIIQHEFEGHAVFYKKFKTNVAIPLPPGEYTIVFQESKDKYEFSECTVMPGDARLKPPQRERNEVIQKPPKHEVSIELRQTTQVSAYYKYTGEISHKDNPAIRSPYQRGSGMGWFGGHNKTLSITDTATSALGARGIRSRLGRNVKLNEKMSRENREKLDPYFMAAANKGRRLLNVYVKAEYTKLFDPLNAEYKKKAKEVWQLQKAAVKARTKLRWIMMKSLKNMKSAGVKGTFMHMTDNDSLNMADKMVASGITDVALTDARDKLKDYVEKREKFYVDFKRDLESASAQLKDYSEKKAGVVATIIARQYKMPINAKMGMNGNEILGEKDLEEELKNYAGAISEDFITRGRTVGFAIMRGMGNLSRGTETMSAAGMNVLQSTWDFIFGPWTWTTLLALVMFFFTFTFVGPNTVYVWIFPIIGGGFAFLLNFSDTMQPLDWLTHFMSGAIIGYGAMLFMVSLGANSWTFMTPVWFWIIWAILGFLGVMQFYQTGGWKIAFQGGIILLAFAWLALGPYAAYYQQAIDQVKAPVEIAFRAVDRAFTDVWLLATDPTEFYARQQAINVKPESPLDFSKGVEVTLLDALPPAVPAGQEFAIMAVVKNEGRMNESAKDVTVSFSCRQWCESTNVDVQNAQKLSSKLFQLSKSEMFRGDATSLNARGFKALGQTGRVGETRIATVYMNISYRYSTTTSLMTEIMHENEIARRLQNNEAVFRQVTAAAKSTPGKISLNVGPQPLIYSPTKPSRALLLVSIFSTRDDGVVRLPQGSRIKLSLPKSIGTDLTCDNYQADAQGNLEYIVPKDVEILSTEFQSIYAFICEFTVSGVDDVKTDLITAELPDFTFILTKKKDVTVTPPIGIVYDPAEKQCNKCGNGILEACRTADECHTFSNKNPALGQLANCYFEYAGTGIGGVSPITAVGNACHSCGNAPSCDQFISQESCESAKAEGKTEAQVCGLSTCYWDPEAVRQSMIRENDAMQSSSLSATKGMCKTRETTAGVTATATGAVNVMPQGLTPEIVSMYLARNAKNSLAEQGQAFFSLGTAVGIDPTFAVAVAMFESGRGTSTNALEKNNYFGITEPGGEGYGFRSFATPEAGIAEFYDRIANSYVPNGQTTPDKIACGATSGYTTHCYVVTGRDNWLRSVPIFRQEILNMISMASGYPQAVPATNYISAGDYQEKIIQKAPQRSTQITHIVLHHTAGSSISGALSANIQTGTNEHYIVDKSGVIVAVVPEELSAQHANCMNPRSIGIEIVNMGDGTDPYPEVQLESLRSLLGYLISKYSIAPTNIIGHGCTNTGKLADEPTGLAPDFYPGITIAKRANSPVICPMLC